MPRPAIGKYRLHVTDDEGRRFDVEYEVREEGVPSPWGMLMWEPEGDCYRSGRIALQCLGDGHFVGVNDGRVYEGTCERIA